MKTTLIDGVTPAKFDKQITGNLLLETTTTDEVRKEKLLIGVRNEDGEIYRLIGATKHNSFTNAVEELEDLELIDELSDVEGTQEGCDAIFRQE
ncbi:hypothetical protein [Pseudoduganella chitinolytica]|uniref:Uncharacterized protein n=1 Tax=Pseudoduganella chitinolytica TaxID=34070 RepID=A0ABY8BJ26_9BURK|nr:hypothetical protein [Pseudoduganella chitinolytica]WEF35972.1 hypothetical protein PX653_19905 [Pseudoduganella chitinolytica]